MFLSLLNSQIDSVKKVRNLYNVESFISKMQRIMRKEMRYTVGVVLFLWTLGVHGQDFQRQVICETSTIKTFKIPCDVELDLLSELDFIYLEAKPPLARQAEFTINDYWLTIAFTYP